MTYREYLNADPTYTSARQTNQSDHGWDFRPAPKSRKDTPLWMVILGLVGGPAVLFFAGVMLT